MINKAALEATLSDFKKEHGDAKRAILCSTTVWEHLRMQGLIEREIESGEIYHYQGIYVFRVIEFPLERLMVVAL